MPEGALHGASRDGDAALRAVRRAAARARRAGGDRRVRRDDGRRARERRTRDAMAGTMNAPRVILASQSPRRRELLTLVGIPHIVRPADIDEAYLPGEQPAAHAERLAREKAAVVAREHPDAVVIGSGTIGVVDCDLLGKAC